MRIFCPRENFYEGSTSNPGKSILLFYSGVIWYEKKESEEKIQEKFILG